MVTICRSVLVPAIKGEQKVNKKVNLKVKKKEQKRKVNKKREVEKVKTSKGKLKNEK